MMDYYSNFGGPSKNEAIIVLQQTLKPQLLKTYSDVQARGFNLNEAIDESILEGVNSISPVGHDEPSFAGSQTGWAVFGKKSCIDATELFLKEKIKDFKKNYHPTATKQFLRNLPQEFQPEIIESIKSLTRSAMRRTKKKRTRKPKKRKTPQRKKTSQRNKKSKKRKSK